MATTLNDRKVLVVDDDQDLVTLLVTLLRAKGVDDIETANDGSKALRLIGEKAMAFDVVICDWMMPEMSGVEFLRAFRAKFPSTPFIMLTAKTRSEELIEAKQLGADYFFMKPLSPEGLDIRMIGALGALL